jgi:hypothetical protein
MLFNVNQDIKWTYMNGINRILKEVFNENYIEVPPTNQLPGIYDIEGPGRSVINKLNTNYTAFCILLKDLNQVITTIPNKKPITFTDKTPAEQKKEVERFVNALDHFKYRIFDTQSSTFINLLRTLTEKNNAGDKRGTASNNDAYYATTFKLAYRFGNDGLGRYVNQTRCPVIRF